MRCVTMHFFLSVATDKLASADDNKVPLPGKVEAAAPFFAFLSSEGLHHTFGAL